MLSSHLFLRLSFADVSIQEQILKLFGNRNHALFKELPLKPSKLETHLSVPTCEWQQAVFEVEDEGGKPEDLACELSPERRLSHIYLGKECSRQRDQQCTDCWSVEDSRVSGEAQMEPGPRPLKALKTVTQHLGFIVGGGKPSEGAPHSLLNGLQGVKCESRLPLRA